MEEIFSYNINRTNKSIKIALISNNNNNNNFQIIKTAIIKNNFKKMLKPN